MKQENGLYSHLGFHCFQFCLRMFHQGGPKKTVVGRVKWHILGSDVCWWI